MDIEFIDNNHGPSERNSAQQVQEKMTTTIGIDADNTQLRGSKT